MNDDSGDDQGTGVSLLPSDWRANNFSSLVFGAAPLGLVHGTRDLVDWFPVFVNAQSLLKSQPLVTNLTLRLSQADGALSFVETSLTAEHCLDYLTDTNAAQLGRATRPAERCECSQ